MPGVITETAPVEPTTTTVSLKAAARSIPVTEINGQENDTTATAQKILDIIYEHRLQKSIDAHDKWQEGTPKFLAVINKFLKNNEQLKMCIPAFPFKSANKVVKVLGELPDKAEEAALEWLERMCERIDQVYAPGAKMLIISDGLVYNDLLTIPDREVWNYGQTLRSMAEQKGFSHIEFSRLKDLAHVPNLPEKLEEITYVANATNFRRALLNQFGNPDFSAEKEIASKEDTKLTYCGYVRFLENDLKYIYASGRTGNGYKRDVKYIAKQMIMRGDAFARAVKNSFPEYLRLSIHHSTGEHKLSISLLPTETSYTTPWHCSVGIKSNGKLVSRPKEEFEDDPFWKLVYEDGRPSHFEEVEMGEDSS